jgi:RNA polymerase sigma factor (sigma-70 family)
MGRLFVSAAAGTKARMSEGLRVLSCREVPLPSSGGLCTMSPRASSARFLQSQTDARLLELSRAGNEPAFEAVVRRYRHELMAYCRRLTVPESSLEDVLQQALLQAWVAIRRDAEIQEVRAWLYQIVHNVAVSNFRRSAAHAVSPRATVGADGADREAERRLAARDALAGLAALPEMQRQVMLSTALEGRSHDEIAATLGLSHGSVRGLIYRARAALRSAVAALVPAPVINLTSRQDVRAGGALSRLLEGISGGGSAGIGGLVLKGTAIVATAGVLAGVAGLKSIHRSPWIWLNPPAHTTRAANHPAGGGRSTAASLRPATNVASSAESGSGAAHATAVLAYAPGSPRVAGEPHRGHRPSPAPRTASLGSRHDRAGGSNSGRLGGGSGSIASTHAGSPVRNRPSGISSPSTGSNGDSSSGSSNGDGGQAGGGSSAPDSGFAQQNYGGSSSSANGEGPDAVATTNSDDRMRTAEAGGWSPGTHQGSSDSAVSGAVSGGSDSGVSGAISGGSNSGASGAPIGGSDIGSSGAASGGSDGAPSGAISGGSGGAGASTSGASSPGGD